MAARIDITGVEAVVSAGTSLFFDIGDGGDTVQKLVMKLEYANDITIDSILDLERKFLVNDAKLFLGYQSDLLVIIYLNADDPFPNAEELKYIADRIPGVVPFCPRNAVVNDGEGIVRVGDSDVDDSVADKVL
jgi:hypothetical protein